MALSATNPSPHRREYDENDANTDEEFLFTGSQQKCQRSIISRPLAPRELALGSGVRVVVHRGVVAIYGAAGRYARQAGLLPVSLLSAGR
ncbi:hypothetical protein ACFQ23_06975 [Schaalia naturae]|jgi:hypothetical protein|uniref:Uncharacterized protein n=1 Tax=Schaalia naturae TaxID=635203 RepID=A0ABW2SJY8_9ACTO